MIAQSVARLQATKFFLTVASATHTRTWRPALAWLSGRAIGGEGGISRALGDITWTARGEAVGHGSATRLLERSDHFEHRVKPGISGWAQVNGWRGETGTLEKMQKRVDCDLYYIRNWSLWLDIKILALTVVRGFVQPNAY